MERRMTFPGRPGALLGRDDELAVLARLLDDRPLVTLTGPPGVGKTRLALAAAAADRSHDAVVVVDLTRLRDPGLVAAELAAAVSPTPGPAGAPPARPAGAPAGRRLLLVLDNVEHLLPAAAQAVADLLESDARLTVLATSRERLHLRTEREQPVAPLAAGPALALLVERVRAFDPDFAVSSADQEVLTEICRRLDGLPLALELAAPRLRLFNPAQMLFRLRSRAARLAADAVDVPDRHRTLESALGWSYDLLDAEERTAFRQLSVFVGGWTLEAASRVCTVADVEAVTASLVDKSLVRRIEAPGDAARFGMLESLRTFAGDLLEASAELDATRDRHAAFFAGLAAGIEHRVGTADERSAIEEVGLEVGNLRGAFTRLVSLHRPAHGLPIASALGWYCYTRGQLGEGQAMLEDALAAVRRAAEPADDAALAGALLMVGAIALARGDVDAAETWLLDGLAVNERAGSLRVRAIGTAFLGHVARARERPAEAVARHEEAGRLHEQLRNVPGVAWSRYDLGLLARRRRQPEHAAALLREALWAFRELRYDWAIACSAWALATVEVSRGHDREAAALLEEALAAFAAADDVRGVAQCLETTAALAAHRGDAAAAARLVGAAASVRERLSAPLPAEEQGAVGAVRLRLRHELGTDAAGDAEQAGRALSPESAVALARDVLALPAPRRAVLDDDDAGDGGLTPREAEVAALVRNGCTNRQIGRRLGISEKTAEVHVHHVMRKLGAGNRAEVAAWVAARDRSAPEPAP